MKNFFLKTIQIYRRTISPYLGNHCRFHPSCSVYAEQAVTQRGVARGFFLTALRLLKCQPFHPGGFDPIE